jgi:hypothetical protein
MKTANPSDGRRKIDSWARCKKTRECTGRGTAIADGSTLSEQGSALSRPQTAVQAEGVGATMQLCYFFLDE